MTVGECPVRDPDILTSTVFLHPGAGERRTATQWYRFDYDPQAPQEVIGAVHLSRLEIMSKSPDAFRELAGLCSEVADRMEQMYAGSASAAPGAGEGDGQ